VSEESTTPDLEERGERLVDAVNARDFDAMASFYAHDAVYDTSRQGLGVFEGRAAIRDFLDEALAMVEDLEFGYEERRDLGNGVVFAICVMRARPLGSPAWGELRYAVVATWRGGLIVRSTSYRDIDEARAAAERLAQERG
jgi:ketosteroid isomerase-like protein